MTEHESKYLVPLEVIEQLGKRKGVRIALIRGHPGDLEVLLTTEQKGLVYHSLPGGKVDQSDYETTSTIGEAFVVALARELQEELGLPEEEFFEHVRDRVTYFDFATLTKFNSENPLSEVIFYCLFPDVVLEKLDLGGQSDVKIVDFSWFPMIEVIENYQIEDQEQLPPHGEFVFVDDHIPVIIEKLYEKLSSGKLKWDD